MKRIITIIALLASLAFCTWLFWHQPSQMPKQNVAPPTPVETTNIQTPIQGSMFLSPVPLLPAPSTNVPVRPASVDEDTWNRWLAYRQMILNEDQPMEFYARVVDQNEQPIEGAKLTLKLARIEGMAFATTNFSAWDPAKAMREIYFDVFSDSNGWIQVTGTNGSFLDMRRLSKEGYSASYPDGNFGGVHYEPHGVRTTYGGDIQLTNALIPQKGYILHLQKVEEK